MRKSAEELLADRIDILTPKILLEVVKDLKVFVANGLLVQRSGTCSLNEIKEGMPWPEDLINIEFETIPGKTIYLLSCETFHGAGGFFTRIS